MYRRTARIVGVAITTSPIQFGKMIPTFMRLIDFQYREERNFRTLSPSFYGHSTLVVKLEAMGLKGFEGSHQDASNLDAG